MTDLSSAGPVADWVTAWTVESVSELQMEWTIALMTEILNELSINEWFIEQISEWLNKWLISPPGYEPVTFEFKARVMLMVNKMN
jgi:hypothetical protein